MSRNKYPEETVERILTTSERLFLEKGYEKTTIQDIVDGLGGLTKGALYHHFKSKEEILLGVAERVFSESDERDGYFEIADSSDSAEKKIGRILALVLQDKNENKLRRIYPDLKKTPQFLVKMLLNCVDSDLPKLLARVIRQGISEGVFKTRYPEELAQIFMMIMNLWANPFVLQTDKSGLERKLAFSNELLSKYGISPLEELMPEGSFNRIFDLLP